VAGVAKSKTTPAHVYWSLIRSCHSNQAIAHPLKRRGTGRFNIGSMGSTGPHRQLPNQSSPSLPAGGHVFTGSTHPQCTPQPTGARESPRVASERPRSKESQSPEQPCLNSVSTDNPMDEVHPSSPRKPPPHLGRPEATSEMWKPSKPTPLTADKVSPLRRTATHRNPRNPYKP